MNICVLRIGNRYVMVHFHTLRSFHELPYTFVSLSSAALLHSGGFQSIWHGDQMKAHTCIIFTLEVAILENVKVTDMHIITLDSFPVSHRFSKYYTCLNVWGSYGIRLVSPIQIQIGEIPFHSNIVHIHTELVSLLEKNCLRIFCAFW